MTEPGSIEGYLCLDVTDPRVAWAAYRGVLISATTSSPFAISLRAATLLQEYGGVRLHNELLIEETRIKHAPSKISRLRGLFAFLDLASAKEATSWGGHFDPTLRVECFIQGSGTSSPVDANWITYAPQDPQGYLRREEQGWIASYWLGEPYPRADPIWEIIVDGRVTIYGSNLRSRAYDVVRETWPNTLTFLEVARIAACLGHDLGHLSGILMKKRNTYKIDYVMDMREADDANFLEELRRHLKEEPGEVNWSDLRQHQASGSFGEVPDLRVYASTLGNLAAT